MFTIVEPMGGSVYTPGAAILAGGSAVNPLAAVPWKAQWKFNNSGADAIGANTLTNNNSATFTTGKLGGATGATQLVSASTQYWSIASNSNLQAGDNDFLVCGWAYADTAHTGVIISKGTISVNGEYRVQVISSGSDVKFRFQVSDIANTFKTVTSTNAYATSAWHFFAAWHDATADKIYINVNNGTTDEATTAGIAVATQTQPVCVGDQNSFSSPYNGRLDNVAFAKGTGAVPTAAILSALYNGGAGTESFT